MKSNKPYSRSKRFSDQIRQIVSNYFIENKLIPDSGIITVTRVETSKDLRHTSIYLSFINNSIDHEQIIKLINQDKGKVRYYLGKSIESKYVPQIKFFFDEQHHIQTRMHSIISKINSNDK